ncbi:MAG: class I fructose-bisphosphate aldolase [Verrucomicrobiia bacterium]|jgi:DhnA family fructose-bisphosphate aldolase class Ia
MKNIRFERLFNRDERSVIVAVDHCLFDGPIPGMVNLPETVKKIDPCVDGILLSPGMIPHCRHAFNYKGAPLAVARINWSTVYCFHWNYRDAATVPAFSPAEALRLGADVVLISLTLETGSEERDARNVEVYRSMCEQARALGIPVIGEYFPAQAEQLSPEQLHKKVFACARIIAELGADLIKTFHTCRFREVVESCPVPILGLGAKKTPTQLEALKLAETEVAEGAGGVVFGRNAIQVSNPGAFQRALCDVVKRGMSAADAVKKHGLKD